MALPHSPGRASDLSSMADSDSPSRTRRLSHKSSGSSILSKLVAGKHPFSKSARKLHEPIEVPPRDASLPVESRRAVPSSSYASGATEEDAIASTHSSLSNLEQQSGADTPQETNATDHSTIGLTPLEQQRQELVDRVVAEARNNKKAPLDEIGRRRFEQAGFGDLIDKQGDVEVETHWLKPVVHVSHPITQLNLANSPGNHCPQDTYRVSHRDRSRDTRPPRLVGFPYSSIGQADGSPRIQPIHDPDPIMLQPRHRMFSPRTGHWHEVIGDAEAISLLGEDAFLNGPKQYREIRRAALPGLDSSYEDQPEEIKAMYNGKARVIERETVEGGPTGHWHKIMGGSSSKEDVDDDVHLVDGLEGLPEGIRTMHVSI